MARLRVGVLRGGPSPEYEVSLRTGSAILGALDEERYQPIDVFVDRSGLWHLRGIPSSPEKVLRQLDLAVNALHGAYGEDGTLQRLLEAFGIPFTGSGSLPASVAMNKALAKRCLAAHGVRTPRHVVLGVSDDLDRRLVEIFRSFPQPSVVKPLASGSSVGVAIARDFPSLREGVRRAFEHGHAVLVEEYIRGREATCGVVDNFRGEEIYALFPIEILPPSGKDFFDYEAKYTGITEERCPGNFPPEAKREIMETARAAHRLLGLRHYSRSDFIVSPRGVYFLEVNALPGLTDESLVPKALAAAGCGLREFVDHLVALALARG